MRRQKYRDAEYETRRSRGWRPGWGRADESLRIDSARLRGELDQRLLLKNQLPLLPRPNQGVIEGFDLGDTPIRVKPELFSLPEDGGARPRRHEVTGL